MIEAEETSGAFCVEYTPTFKERFWRALGYHSRVPEFPPEAPQLNGWIMTNVEVHVDFADRLRLLVSGEAKIRIETRTSVPVDHAISASSFEVKAP